ncbi:MAG: hypothetical protein U0791_11915 [Gemmataceae bacterium]
MITFECPGCTKPLEANRAFAGFDTRCLRCGTVIRIPTKTGGKVDTLAKAALPKPKAVVASSRVPELPVIPEQTFVVDLGPDLTPPPVDTKKPTAPKRRSLKPESVSEPTPLAPPSASTTSDTEKTLAKRKKLIGGSIGGLVLVIALAAYGLSGGNEKPQTKKPESTPSSAPPRQVETEPAPPDPPKKTPSPPALNFPVAPAPRAIRPAVEYELTASALLQEYVEGPPACDQKYDGKDLLVRGIYHQFSLGKVTVISGDPKAYSLVFTLASPPDARAGDLFPDPGLTPGQPVVLRGTYQSGCRFSDATIELTDSPAERAYTGKPVWLEGAFVRSVNGPTGSVPFPTVVLEPHATDSKVSVTCFFKSSDSEEILKLKPGQKVDVRGRCAGRSYLAVRLDNCSLVDPANPPGAEVTKVATTAFFTEFETDLLPAPRVMPRDPTIEPLPVTAEGLGHAFQVDPRSANIAYRNKVVQLSGYVKERHAATRMLVFQCGTDTSYSIAAMFSPNAFDNLPDEKTMVIRGVCSGTAGGYVRIESAEYAEIADGAAALRTDLDFLPYRLGKEYIVDQVSPSRGKESAIRRTVIGFSGDDKIHVVLQKTGTIPGHSLFRDPLPEPKWANYTPKTQPLLRHYRIREGTVEIGQGDFWEPVLKAGLKRGQSWSAKFPDGRIATYTVTGFAKQPGTELDILDIRRTLRSPTDPTRWEETASTYVRGIGEVRRITSNRTDRGESMVISELKLVSDGSAGELRNEPKK